LEDADRTIGQVSGLVGNPPRQGLVAALKERIGGDRDFRALEQKVQRLTLEATKARSRATEAERRSKEALLQANTSAAALLQVETALSLPADVVMKARAFDARLERDDHVSSKKVIAFMMEQTATVEATFESMRTLVSNLTHILPRISEEDTGSSEDDTGSETEKDQEDAGVQSHHGKHDVVDLDNPEGPAQIPPLATPTPHSASDVTTHGHQRWGNEEDVPEEAPLTRQSH